MVQSPPKGPRQGQGCILSATLAFLTALSVLSCGGYEPADLLQDQGQYAATTPTITDGGATQGASISFSVTLQ